MDCSTPFDTDIKYNPDDNEFVLIMILLSPLTIDLFIKGRITFPVISRTEITASKLSVAITFALIISVAGLG